MNFLFNIIDTLQCLGKMNGVSRLSTIEIVNGVKYERKYYYRRGERIGSFLVECLDKKPES